MYVLYSIQGSIVSILQTCFNMNCSTKNKNAMVGGKCGWIMDPDLDDKNSGSIQSSAKCRDPDVQKG